MYRLPISFITIVIVLVLSQYYLRLKNRRRLPLPPGPKGLPWIGNLFQVPKQYQAKVIGQEWVTKYGDVIYFHVFGRQFVVLNSVKAVEELLVQRGTIYSYRPHLVMAGDLVGRSMRTTLFHQPTGDRHRKLRTYLTQALHPKQGPEFWPIIEQECGLFLESLLQTPGDFISHARKNSGASTLKIAYGFTIKDNNDPLIVLAASLSRLTTVAAEPGRWLVDSFPWMKHIPSWLPGAGFKRWAAHSWKLSTEFTDKPFDDAKFAMENGFGMASFVSRSLESLKEKPSSVNQEEAEEEEEDIIKVAAASIYAGGSDTTVSVVSTFFLMMALHPDILCKAQAEIDQVVGLERLPVLADQHRLPYLNALVKELHRINPVTPFVPHSLAQDNEYRGFRIPKGAWVSANNWAIFNNPSLYKDPGKFMPERHLGADPDPDPLPFSFGYGRRQCPGNHLANAFLYFAIAQTLATFDILKPLDPNGDEYVPNGTFDDGHISHPHRFNCRIIPRPNKLNLIPRSRV